jgi:hypothetical protein
LNFLPHHKKLKMNALPGASRFSGQRLFILLFILVTDHSAARQTTKPAHQRSIT